MKYSATVELIKIGDAFHFIIPDEVCEALKISEGDMVNVTLENHHPNTDSIN